MLADRASFIDMNRSTGIAYRNASGAVSEMKVTSRR